MIYSTGQAAAILGCSPETLRRYESLGHIRFERLGDLRIVSEADLVALRALRATLPPARGRRRRPLRVPVLPEDSRV